MALKQSFNPGSNFERQLNWAAFLGVVMASCGHVIAQDANLEIKKDQTLAQTFFQNFETAIKDCRESTTRIDTPQLGNAAPPVRVIYPARACANIERGSAGIYVQSKDGWSLAYSGPYSRGNTRVGRGGKSYVYWLISDKGPNARLTYLDNALTLRIDKTEINLFERPQ